MESSISENTLYYSFNESVNLETTIKECSEETDSFNNTKSNCENEEIQKSNVDGDEEHQVKELALQPNATINPEILNIPIINTIKPDILEHIPTSSAVIDNLVNQPKILIQKTPMCAEKININVQTDKVKKSDNKENKKIYMNNRKTFHAVPSGTGLLEPPESLTTKKKMSSKTIKSLNSPRILKTRARLSNVIKTTLNSPSMTRRSLAFKAATTATRKSMIPVSQTTDKKLIPKSTTASKTVTTFSNENVKAQSILYTCRVCHTSFKFKSLLEAHKKMHSITIKCEYCDKTFSVNKALDNHLLENCNKIPPLVKKKLIQATINNKIEQQQNHQQHWPKEFTSTSTPLKLSVSSNTKNSSVKKGNDTYTANNRNLSNSSTQQQSLSVDDDKKLQSNFMIPQLIVSKSTKKTKTNKLPFSGIYRTPTKPIICYKCEKKFLTILAFTAHSFSHSSSQSSSESCKEDSKEE